MWPSTIYEKLQKIYKIKNFKRSLNNSYISFPCYWYSMYTHTHWRTPWRTPSRTLVTRCAPRCGRLVPPLAWGLRISIRQDVRKGVCKGLRWGWVASAAAKSLFHRPPIYETVFMNIRKLVRLCDPQQYMKNTKYINIIKLQNPPKQYLYIISMLWI